MEVLPNSFKNRLGRFSLQFQTSKLRLMSKFKRILICARGASSNDNDNADLKTKVSRLSTFETFSLRFKLFIEIKEKSLTFFCIYALNIISNKDHSNQGRI